MTEQDTIDSSTSSVDKILSHQLFVVEKDPIKDKAWEKQQEKALQQQSQKVEVKDGITYLPIYYIMCLKPQDQQVILE